MPNQDDHIIEVDNMIIKPLTTVQMRERAKKKQEKAKKAKKGNK